MSNLLASVTACLALGLFATTPAGSQDLSLFLKKDFTGSDGTQLPYRILYPAKYEAQRKYPLILVLHGAGERGSDNEKQLVHGSKLFLDSTVRAKYPAIVVFPQCPEQTYWSSVKVDRSQTPLMLDFDYSRPVTGPLKAFMELVQELINSGTVDKRCVYVTGLSMGGMGTFEIVHRYPGIFAAALPICGGGDTLRYKKVDVPFWVFHGSNDSVVDVAYSRAMVARLKELRVKTRYTEYPGVNHNSWDNAFAEPDFLRWMFKRRR